MVTPPPKSIGGKGVAIYGQVNKLNNFSPSLGHNNIIPHLIKQSNSTYLKLYCIYLQVQPEHIDLEDLCPTPPPCPNCPPRIETGRCRSGGFALLDMVGWEVYPLGNATAPTPSNRTQGPFSLIPSFHLYIKLFYNNPPKNSIIWSKYMMGRPVYEITARSLNIYL